MIYSVEFTKDDRTWFEAAELFDLDEAEILLDKFPAEHRGWYFTASRIVGHLGNSNNIVKYKNIIMSQQEQNIVECLVAFGRALMDNHDVDDVMFVFMRNAKIAFSTEGKERLSNEIRLLLGKSH